MGAEVNHFKVEHVPQHAIHQALEDCQSVAEATMHHQVLIVTPQGVGGCIPFVALPDLDQVVAFLKFSFAKTVALWRGSNTDDTNGKGYRFFTAMMHVHRDLSSSPQRRNCLPQMTTDGLLDIFLQGLPFVPK